MHLQLNAFNISEDHCLRWIQDDLACWPLGNFELLLVNILFRHGGCC